MNDLNVGDLLINFLNDVSFIIKVNNDTITLYGLSFNMTINKENIEKTNTIFCINRRIWKHQPVQL